MTFLVKHYIQHHRLILVISGLLTIAAGWYASGLRIDADLERLLPDDAPSVQGLRQLDAEYGIIGRINIVLSDGDVEAMQTLTDELAGELAELDGVTRTENQRPIDFFETHRLLYLDTSDLETIHKRISKRIRWEKQRANPLFVDVGNSKKPTLDMSDIEEKYDAQNPERYYCKTKDGDVTCVVFVFPEFSAGDLKRTRALVEQIETVTGKRLDGTDVSFGLSGRYKKRIDQQDALTRDLAFGTTVALVLLLIFLLLYFNGLTTASIVLGPLIMGTIWSFAYARYAFESLNILTGFFGAVLLGLGIDYGIHLVSRYLEVRQTESTEEALLDTLRSAGKASIFAGITTVVAFGSLMTSSFLAFFEYGAIALGGMTLVIIANIVVLPCILLAVNGTRFDPKPTLSVRMAKSADRMVTFLKARKHIIGVLFLVVVTGAILGVRGIDFEYDFEKIQNTDLDSWHLDEHVDEILDVSQIPVVFLLDDVRDAEEVAAVVRKRKETMPQAWTVDRVVTRSDVVPPDQEKKRGLIADLHKKFSKLPSSAIKDDVKKFKEEIDGLHEEGELTFDKLPESIRDPLSVRDGNHGAVTIVFPTIAQHDAKEMMDLAAVIRNVPLDGDRTVDGINDSLLLVDILDAVRKDSVKMLTITLIGLLLTAIVAFRRPRRVFLLVATITLASLTAAGWVGLLQIKFNFINMLTIPIWIGLGVDAAFHLMVRAEDAPEDFSGFVATAFAVTAAFVTSIIGFGAMLVTNHGGLFSMGATACVGLAAILFISMCVQWATFSHDKIP